MSVFQSLSSDLLAEGFDGGVLFVAEPASWGDGGLTDGSIGVLTCPDGPSSTVGGGELLKAIEAAAPMTPLTVAKKPPPSSEVTTAGAEFA